MKKWWWIACLLMSFLLFVKGRAAAELLATDAKTVQVFIKGSPVSKDRTEEILRGESEREDTIPACFWSDLGETSLLCKETGKSARVEEIVAVGDLAVFTGRGNVLADSDKQACLVDAKTAAQLFGAVQTGAQQVSLQGEIYRVYGSFPSHRRLLVRLSSKKEAHSFDRASLLVTAPRARKQRVTQWLSRASLEGQAADFYSLAVLLLDLTLLFPLVFLVRLFSVLHAAENRARYLAYPVLLVGVLCLFHFVRIPQDMIPSRWSDFSFWGRWLSDQIRQIGLFFSV